MPVNGTGATRRQHGDDQHTDWCLLLGYPMTEKQFALSHNQLRSYAQCQWQWLWKRGRNKRIWHHRYGRVGSLTKGDDCQIMDSFSLSKKNHASAQNPTQTFGISRNTFRSESNVQMSMVSLECAAGTLPEKMVSTMCTRIRLLRRSRRADPGLFSQLASPLWPSKEDQ